MNKKNNNKQKQVRFVKNSKARRGHEISVPPMPSSFTSRPWYSQIVRIENIGTSLSTVAVSAALSSQVALQSSVGLPIFELRIFEIRVWGALVPFGSSTPLAPVVVSFLDFIGNPAPGVRVLEEITRYPDLTRRAAVGYKYSEAHSNVAMGSGGTQAAFDLLRTSGLGVGSVIYVNLLFRSSAITL
jgi:hypothetical protein